LQYPVRVPCVAFSLDQSLHTVCGASALLVEIWPYSRGHRGVQLVQRTEDVFFESRRANSTLQERCFIR
jgi:hypothetical protein